MPILENYITLQNEVLIDKENRRQGFDVTISQIL